MMIHADRGISTRVVVIITVQRLWFTSFAQPSANAGHTC